jgi:hypothetical protein
VRPVRGALCVVLLALPACGADERPADEAPVPELALPSPSLTAGEAGAGEALAPSHRFEEGETWRIEVTIEEVERRTESDGPERPGGGSRLRPPASQWSGRLRIEQTFHVHEGRPDRTTFMVAVEEVGERVRDRLSLLQGLTGTYEHAPDGRPRSESTVLLSGGGGVAPAGVKTTLWNRPWFAGAAGTPPWLPPRAVRAGEVWSLDEVLPEDVRASIVTWHGGDAADVVTKGGVRLRGLVEHEGGMALDVEMDATMEARGEARHEDGSVRIRSGLALRGRAAISLRTGLPFEWRLTQIARVRSEGGAHSLDHEILMTGRARRTSPERR